MEAEELLSLRLSELLKRAAAAGVPAATVNAATDAEDPKSSVVRLIYGQARLSELIKRAEAAGVPASAINAATDTADPKRTVVDLLLAAPCNERSRTPANGTHESTAATPAAREQLPAKRAGREAAAPAPAPAPAPAGPPAAARAEEQPAGQQGRTTDPPATPTPHDRRGFVAGEGAVFAGWSRPVTETSVHGPTEPVPFLPAALDSDVEQVLRQVESSSDAGSSVRQSDWPAVWNGGDAPRAGRSSARSAAPADEARREGGEGGSSHHLLLQKPLVEVAAAEGAALWPGPKFTFTRPEPEPEPEPAREMRAADVAAGYALQPVPSLAPTLAHLWREDTLLHDMQLRMHPPPRPTLQPQHRPTPSLSDHALAQEGPGERGRQDPWLQLHLRGVDESGAGGETFVYRKDDGSVSAKLPLSRAAMLLSLGHISDDTLVWFPAPGSAVHWREVRTCREKLGLGPAAATAERIGVFYERLGGEMSGELTIGEMARLLAAGRISEDTRVWTEGMADLQRLGDCMRQGGELIQIRVQAERVRAADDMRSPFEQHVLAELDDLRNEAARLREMTAAQPHAATPAGDGAPGDPVTPLRPGAPQPALAAAGYEGAPQLAAVGFEPMRASGGPKPSQPPPSLTSEGRPAQIKLPMPPELPHPSFPDGPPIRSAVAATAHPAASATHQPASTGGADSVPASPAPSTQRSGSAIEWRQGRVENWRPGSDCTPSATLLSSEGRKPERQMMRALQRAARARPPSPRAPPSPETQQALTTYDVSFCLDLPGRSSMAIGWDDNEDPQSVASRFVHDVSLRPFPEQAVLCADNVLRSIGSGRIASPMSSASSST